MNAIQLSPLHQTGDYICPSYAENGTVKKEGGFCGDSKEIAEMKEKIAANAARSGATLLPIIAPVENPKKRGRPSKKLKAVEPPGFEVVPLKTDITGSAFVAAPISHIDLKPVYEMPKEEPLVLIDVVFKNKFGKITVSVERVLESEIGICLVFPSKDAMRFIPAEAEELELCYKDEQFCKVLYSGIIFPWLDETRQLMILIRTDTHEQSE